MSIDRDFKKEAVSKRRVYFAPRVLTIPKETKEKIIRQMQVAFKGRTGVDDPYLYARSVMRRVINGTKEDGTPWKNAPGMKDDEDIIVLEKRLRVFNYNMRTGEVIPSSRKKVAQRRDKEAAIVQQFLPNESPAVDKRLKYGASINEILTGDELKEYKKFLKQLKSEFPKLDAVSDKLGMEQLALLNIRIKRATIEMASSKSKTISKDVSELGRLYKDLTENLGISGKQRRDELDTEENGSIADLVKRYHNTLKNHPKEEKERFIQECHLMLNAYQRGEVEEHDVIRNVNLGIKEIKDLLAMNKIAIGKQSARVSKHQ